MRVLWFCIPAYGHTNPTIEVVRELVGRGREVRYYSFEEFREKIEGAGAQFVACDDYLPPVDAKAERRLRRVSTTEMSVQSFRTTAAMDETLSRDIAAFRPNLVVSDSACFWGKLTAEKHGLPFDDRGRCEPCRFSMEGAYAATGRLLDRHPDLTAIFAISDVIALGVIRALGDRGHRVPEDISVMGFDGLDVGRYIVPTLSTIRQNGVAMAHRSVEMLLENIKEGQMPRYETVPFDVSIGESIRKN